MPCISIPTAMLISGGMAAAGGIASGVIGAKAAKSAAGVEAAAAEKQSAAQLAMFGQVRDSLKPYMTAGVSSLDAITKLTGTGAGGNPLTSPLTAPFQPTMQQLEATPGYQFTKQQGLRTVQNSFAAQGLGESGAAYRGAIDYAEGLASTTYQQQFQNYLAQNQQIYNMLGGISSLGEGAAAGVGQMGMNAQTQAGNIALGGASATAAGTVGAANALNAGIGAATSGISNAATILAMSNGGMFGNRSPGSTTGSNAGTNLLFGGNTAPPPTTVYKNPFG